VAACSLALAGCDGERSSIAADALTVRVDGPASPGFEVFVELFVGGGEAAPILRREQLRGSVVRFDGLAPGAYEARLALEFGGAPVIALCCADTSPRRVHKYAQRPAELCFERQPMVGAGGRVRLGGEPCGDAVLFIEEPGRHGRTDVDWNDALASAHPNVVEARPGTDGRFAIAVSQRRPVLVRARHARGANASDAVPVTFGERSVVVDVPTGGIVGSVPVHDLEVRQREMLMAALFTEQQADVCAFNPGGCYSPEMLWRVPSHRSIVDGRFSFANVRPGRYLLRVFVVPLDPWSPVLWQRWVTIADEVVDLETVELESRVDVAIGVAADPAVAGLLLYEVADGRLAWRSAGVVGRGTATFELVPPGEYEVLPCRIGALSGGRFAEVVHPVPMPQRVMIAADGSVTPDSVRF